MLSGASGAAELRLGLGGAEVVEGYVDEHGLSALISRHALRPSRQPNVVLRVVPSFLPSWPMARVAPRAAVALDLLDDDEPRVRQVGKELLERLSQ
jgi:hypothetical protein